jgi:predicted O-linked N-acetylglucosamine transferase (SPINDLY family)
LRNGHVTFGCLNNFCKINRSVIRLWAEVLNTVDRSQLVLLAGEGSHRQQTLREFAREGVTSDRITFVGRQTRDNYLQVYHSIDLGLDTFPYNGHTTSLDSYWMGVPVITLVGQTAVGRAGFSQLSNLSMAHRELVKLITRSSSQFVYVANELVGNLEALSKLRATLREHMQRSPLMNAVRFARNIEAVYESIWLRIQRSSHKPY